MNKKAAMHVSVRFIIIMIIALVVLILLVSFIRYLFKESSTRLEEEISRYAKPPNAIISSPSPDYVYTIFQDLVFDGSESYDRYYRIVGHYWDFDSDSIIDSNEAIYNHSYWEPGEYNVTLKVINEPGAIGAASHILRVYTGNNKSMSLLEDSLFLIRDNDRVNEETILRLIPVTTWNDASGFHSIPYYVYYMPDQGNTLDQSQLKEVMDKYGKKHAYVFDDLKMDSDCSGQCVYDWDGDTYTLDTFAPGNLDDIYFDFWSLYEYVVLVDKGEDEAKLIASLFAAFYNSPIIFIDSGNLDEYEDYIINSLNTKRVYSVPSFESLDVTVRDFITDNNLDYKSYTPYELRTGNVNRIIRLTSNVTMSPS